MGGVEFSEADVRRMMTAFGLDRDAAVARIEAAVERSRQLAEASRQPQENPS